MEIIKQTKANKMQRDCCDDEHTKANRQKDVAHAKDHEHDNDEEI